MKKTITRFLMSAGTALFLVLSAWTTVSAAKATGRILAGKLIGTAETPNVTETSMATATPVVTGTPQSGDDDQDESMISGTNGGQQINENDDQDEDDGAAVTSGTTGSPQIGEHDSDEHSNHPVINGTPQPENGDDEDHHQSGSGSGSSDDGGDD